MGWYKEYLQDLADIAREREGNKYTEGFLRAGLTFVALGFACWAFSFNLIIGIIGLVIFIILLVMTFRENPIIGVCFVGFLVISIMTVILYEKKVHSDNIDMSSTNNIGQVNSVLPKKFASYLQGVDDIKNATELRDFYYKIASGYYNNEMGLKGTADQIDAGNKIMSGVYGFLGTSISKGGLLDTDSMKNVIQSDTLISNYRKKKALEELNLGIEKIQSIR